MASAAGGDVDVSDVCALTRAARKPANLHRHARGAEQYERALVAAEALRQPDCLIVASLRHMHLVAQSKALVAGRPDEDNPGASATLVAYLALCKARLPAVVEALERRRASGTMLPGRCRAHEVVWYADLLRTDLSHLPADSEHRPPDEGAAMLHVSQAAQQVGLDAYFDAARTVVVTLCGRLTTHPPNDLFQASCLTYAEHALRLVLQCATGELNNVFLSSKESFFVDAFRKALLPLLTPHVLGCARVLAAWHDLEKSGELHTLDHEELRKSAVRIQEQLVNAQAAKDARVPLHTCALPSCGAREAHVALFKKCSACGAVVYCSKQHQAEHWPAHKAACKAARKAAAADKQAAGEGGASQ